MAAWAGVGNDGDAVTPIGEQYPCISAGGNDLTVPDLTPSPSISPQTSTDIELEETDLTLTKKRVRAMTPPAPHTSPPTPIDVPYTLKKGKSVPLVKRETAKIVDYFLKRRSVSLSSADLSEDYRRVRKRNKRKEKRNNTISVTSNISSDSNVFLPRESDSFSREVKKKDYDIDNLNAAHEPMDLNRAKSNSAPSTLRFKAKPCEQDFEKIQRMKDEGLLEPSDDTQIQESKGKHKIKRRKTLLNRARSFIGSPTFRERKEIVDTKEKENRSKVHHEMKKTGFGKRLRKMFGIKKHKHGSVESVESPVTNGFNSTSSLDSYDNIPRTTSPITPSRDERRKIKFPSFLRKKPRKESPQNDERTPHWPSSTGNATTFFSTNDFQYRCSQHSEVVRSSSQPNHIQSSTSMQVAPQRSISRPTSLGLNMSSLSDPTRGFNEVLHINSPLRPGIELRGSGQQRDSGQQLARQAPLASIDDDDLEVDGLSGDDESKDNKAFTDSGSVDISTASAASGEEDDDTRYREVAERLAEIGDSIVGAVGGRSGGASSLPGTCTDGALVDPVVLQDISNHATNNSRFSEDTVIRVVLDTTYHAFSTTVETLIGDDQGWNQVALVLRFTKVAMQAARTIGVHATQIKNNSIEYISDHFAEWVGSQGGWESIIIDDSDGQESEID
ncbi:uncharacterized protein [Antedon mediterranea]|uniref:uncharacterized protein n=1 Tax=Antedon mediterranea TaxID=105859 RepID=UPI003AF948DF